MKKAIFRIPEYIHISKEDFITSGAFWNYDGYECELRKSKTNPKCSFWYFKDGSNFESPSFMEAWLEPIEDEPITAEEWWKQHIYNVYAPLCAGDREFDKEVIIEAFKAGEANSKKKFQSLIDACKEVTEYGITNLKIRKALKELNLCE